MSLAVNIAQIGSNNTTFRNRIINGAMVIDQRNAGAVHTPTSTLYCVDRWHVAMSQNSKFTAQQNAGAVTPPAGFVNYQGITSSSAYAVGASDYFVVRQHIEGFNFADCGFGTASASTVTLSFWVRSSLTGAFGGSLYNSNGTRSYPFTYTINAANTFEQKTITIAGDTTGTWVGATNGVGISVSFSLGAGSTFNSPANAWAGGFYTQPSGSTSVVGTSGATFYITGVQLEAGTTASPFEYRSYGTELALCQRYYENSLNYGVTINYASGTQYPSAHSLMAITTSNLASNVYYKVPKRVSPSLIIKSGYFGTNAKVSRFTDAIDIGTVVTVGWGGEKGFTNLVDTGSGFSAGMSYYFHWETSGAEL
jgi:hypothetical protein